jgi:membrane dipeptidase
MIDLSATPIILSHHGCGPSQRTPAQCCPTRLLKKLAARGGVIHMNALGSFLKTLPQTKERMDAMASTAHEDGAIPDLLGRRRYEQVPR